MLAHVLLPSLQILRAERTSSPLRSTFQFIIALVIDLAVLGREEHRHRLNLISLVGDLTVVVNEHLFGRLVASKEVFAFSRMIMDAQLIHLMDHAVR